MLTKLKKVKELTVTFKGVETDWDITTFFVKDINSPDVFKVPPHVYFRLSKMSNKGVVTAVFTPKGLCCDEIRVANKTETEEYYKEKNND